MFFLSPPLTCISTLLQRFLMHSKKPPAECCPPADCPEGRDWLEALCTADSMSVRTVPQVTRIFNQRCPVCTLPSFPPELTMSIENTNGQAWYRAFKLGE